MLHCIAAVHIGRSLQHSPQVRKRALPSVIFLLRDLHKALCLPSEEKSTAFSIPDRILSRGEIGRGQSLDGLQGML